MSENGLDVDFNVGITPDRGKRVSWENKEKRILFYDKNGKKVSRAKEKNRGTISLVK